MKGFNTDDGYMGYVDGGYQLFASEADYKDWLEDYREVHHYERIIWRFI